MADQQNVPNFIPKEEDSKKVRGHIERIRRYLNGLVFIGAVVFAVGILGTITSVILVSSATKELVQKKVQLVQATEDADEDLIMELNLFDTRLKAAQKLLADHSIASPILNEIADHTLQVVQLKSAEIDITHNGPIMASGDGEALNYQSLATQSDAFSESLYLSDPIFTSFQQNDDGFVAFQYSLQIDPRLSQSAFDTVNNNRSENLTETTIVIE